MFSFQNVDPEVFTDTISQLWNQPSLLIEHAKDLWEKKQAIYDARICIERCLELQPSQILFRVFAVQFYRDINETEMAHKNCDIAIRLCQNDEARLNWYVTMLWVKSQLLFNQRDYYRVVELMNEALKHKHEHEDISYNWRGSAFCELKQYHTAIKDYTKAIDNSKTPASYYNSRGTCYQELRQYSKAMNDYNHALKLDPKSVSAWNNRSSLFVELKKFQQALEDADHGLELFKDHGNLHKHRSMAHFYLGHYMNAIEDVNRAIELCPEYRPARVALKFLWDFHCKTIMDTIIELSTPPLFYDNEDLASEDHNNPVCHYNCILRPNSSFRNANSFFLNWNNWTFNGVNNNSNNKKSTHNPNTVKKPYREYAYFQECTIDIVKIITDYIVGNNYRVTEDMVDATYSDVMNQDEEKHVDENGNLISEQTNENNNEQRPQHEDQDDNTNENMQYLDTSDNDEEKQDDDDEDDDDDDNFYSSTNSPISPESVFDYAFSMPRTDSS